jgi:hypothetical protein
LRESSSSDVRIEEDALERVLDIVEYYRGLLDFANARTMRNVLDQVIMNQNLRTEDMGEDSVIMPLQTTHFRSLCSPQHSWGIKIFI